MNATLIDKHVIHYKNTLKSALEKLNNVPDNLTLFVTDNDNKLVGALTDGDIRRGLLTGLGMEDTVDKFMFKNFRYITQNNFTVQQVRDLKERRIKLVPMVDKDMRILRLIDLVKYKSVLPLNVVIMAGGRGERLKPLTDNLPKPMLLVGDKPILEHNLRHIASFGIGTVHICVNYLGHVIRDYFKNGNAWDINIQYIEEKEPLGTIGAVTLIKDFEYEQILLMNADILTNIDLEDFFNEFIDHQAVMSVASVPYKINMPFAVLETEQNRVLSFSEKPEYTYYTNAGIYILKKDLINRIPKNSMYHATDLMQDLIDHNEKLVQYSLHGFWMDIGRKEDFQRAQQEIKHLTTK